MDLPQDAAGGTLEACATPTPARFSVLKVKWVAGPQAWMLNNDS
jgi:hypothetical protein